MGLCPALHINGKKTEQDNQVHTRKTDRKIYSAAQARHRQTLRNRYENMQHSSNKTQTDIKRQT